MSVKLSDLQKGSKSVSFEFQGYTVNIEYRHGRVTPMVKLSLMAGPKFEEDKNLSLEEASSIWSEYYAEIAQLVLSWDVMDDGKKMPVTVESLSQFSNDFIRALVNAIVRDGLVDPQKPGSSTDTSSQTE